jgi:hypothetical protein
MDTRDHPSIELFQISWLKVVTSQTEMEQEENQSMEKNLLYIIFNNIRMKTSNLSTLNHTFYQWLMLDQTQTDPNSLSLSLHAHGWTESM